MDLTVAGVRRWVERLDASAIKEPCRTCDCFQGLIVQLELDAPDDVTEVTHSAKVTNEQMHGCLGCDPCPPAALFAEYIRANLGRQRASCACRPTDSCHCDTEGEVS